MAAFFVVFKNFGKELWQHLFVCFSGILGNAMDTKSDPTSDHEVWYVGKPIILEQAREEWDHSDCPQNCHNIDSTTVVRKYFLHCMLLVQAFIIAILISMAFKCGQFQ